jgi:DNA/RNA endonuclease G (NUC1)
MIEIIPLCFFSGGTNDWFNLVPQAPCFNREEYWRKLEAYLRRRASDTIGDNGYIDLETLILYDNYGTNLGNRPTHFIRNYTIVDNNLNMVENNILNFHNFVIGINEPPRSLSRNADLEGFFELC